jgi:hypothetical protein
VKRVHISEGEKCWCRGNACTTNKENSRESEWKRESHKDGDALG